MTKLLDLDDDIFNLIHLCSTNSPHSFLQIIYYLDLASDMDLLLEMYDIVYLKEIVPIHITSKLQIHHDKSKIFLNLLWVLYYIIKYELIFEKDRRKETKEDEDGLGTRNG